MLPINSEKAVSQQPFAKSENSILFLSVLNAHLSLPCFILIFVLFGVFLLFSLGLGLNHAAVPVNETRP